MRRVSNMYVVLSGIVWAVLAVVALAMAGGGSPGVLDPSFGQGGVTTVQPNPACVHGCGVLSGSHTEALTIAPSGVIVLASNGGGEWLTRLDANGALDTSFGNGGYAQAANIPRSAISRVSVGADGDVVALASGQEGLGLALERFTAAGVRDSSFGVQGVRWLVASRELVEAAVDAEGRIVVLHKQSGPGGITVSRFLSSGAPDPAFGRRGVSRVHALVGAELVGFATGRDGGVVVVGRTSYIQGQVPGAGQFSLVRLTSAGRLDRSFGRQGVVRVSGALSGGVGVVAVGPKQEILLAHGERLKRPRSKPPDVELIVARYTSKGVLDRSFGVRGVSRAMFAFAPGAIAFAADGDAIVLGETPSYRHSRGTSFLARYTPDGRDCSFANRGFVVGTQGSARAIAVQRDGRIVIAGDAGTAVMAARYIGGGRPQTCPGEGHGA